MLDASLQAAQRIGSAQQARAASRPALPFSIAPGVSADAFTTALRDELAGAGIVAPAQPPPMPGAPVTAADTPTGADPTTAEKEQRIDGVARDLEAVLLYTLLKDMWSTLPQDQFFESGLASKFYREMWLEEVAKRASQTGPGLGVAEAVKRELLDRAKREITPAEVAARKR